MPRLRTFRDKPFRYEQRGDGSIAVYANRGARAHSGRPMLTIERETIALVRQEIASRRRVIMGASRTDPPEGSLGKMLKAKGETPQLLSYLIPILVEQGDCHAVGRGRACLVVSADRG